MSEKIHPTQTKDSVEIKHEQIAELEEPIRNILKEILPKIEKGEYGLIIGIDTSGRIPTLIIDKLVNYIYTQKGNDFSRTRFLAGRGDKEETKKQIEIWGPSKKVLIIDDTFIVGNAIRFLTEALREMKVPFDIVAVSGLGGNYRESALNIGAGKIYIGKSDNAAIVNAKHLSGVHKYAGDKFSKSYKKLMEEEHDNNLPLIQETMNEARADVDVVVNNLIDWYESQKQDK